MQKYEKPRMEIILIGTDVITNSCDIFGEEFGESIRDQELGF